MLSSLFAVPTTPQAWLSWSWNHRVVHDNIRQAIQQKGGLNLPQYELDPMPMHDLRDWLRRNQEAHTDMNGALKLQGVDLTELDPSNEAVLAAWINQEYLELYAAQAALGI